jgi:hypothetical protein
MKHTLETDKYNLIAKVFRNGQYRNFQDIIYFSENDIVCDYGSIEAYEKLLSAAHKRKVRVFMEVNAYFRMTEMD